MRRLSSSATLHLIAHGRPGAFWIGDVWIDAEVLKAHAADLAHWDLETIALWSCHVGADAITTSGLNYDSNGNHRFLLNNVGKWEWLQMQGRLNDTLDAIAAQAESAEH